MTIPDSEIARRAASIRRRCIMMCRGRGQGYVGQGLALADLMAALYFDEFRRTTDDEFVDRRILSTGHSAIALYAALGEPGLYADKELGAYGMDGSRIEESPLAGLPGFHITGGSLGQGLSQAVGFALADRLKGSDARTFCLISDGELQEGQIWEAAMSAGHYGLGSLVVLVDNNGMQADGDTSQVMTVEPVDDKFTAFGFRAERVDANDLPALRAALARTRDNDGCPHALICTTLPGKGSPTLEAYEKVHYVRATDDVWQRALSEIQ
ncbi:transketolase [Gemmatimonas sp.]|uniref:transketolase n=1 Tax=Gemmatimonas sp. TaxID=1962908 RepID=UPI003568F24A